MLKKNFFVLASLWMFVLAPMSLSAASNEFNLINGLSKALKKDAKSKDGPSLLVQGYNEALEQMGSASDFDDYVAPTVTKNNDMLATLLGGMLNKSEFSKINKAGMLKEGSSEREWLKAFVTVSVDVAYRKELVTQTEYELTQVALAQIWGSKDFMKNRLPQMYDFFIAGSLVSTLPANSDEFTINLTKEMLNNGLA